MSVFSKLIYKFPIKISAYDLQDRQVYYKANLVESRNTRNQKTQQKNSKWGLVLSDIKIHLKTSKIVSSNYHTIALISHANKVIRKILQARLQLYMNRELPNVQARFRKGRGTRDQIANICWITEKAREFQKNIYFCFIDYAKAFDCVDHNKLWKILKETGIADHLTCLLRNLYVQVRKQQLEMDMEQQTGSK